jgi:hypothetical protein
MRTGMRKYSFTFRTLMGVLFGVLGSNSALALARFECHGITKDVTILTPFVDGSVNLSFNSESISAKSKFWRGGDVFVAEFKQLGGQAGADYSVIIDTISGAGYEYVSKPPEPASAIKMTCYFFKQ